MYALHDPCVADQPLDMVVLLLDLPGEGACQPHVGAALWLDDEGRITREERYHRVDSVRACLDTKDLPSGWWESLTRPAARGDRHRGRRRERDHRVERHPTA